ncbi:helix-turn-helix transcriptional regulator [Myxococcus sp. SDU36]|uniref:helix-turn-helix domain-containing protein n=1 Tax=Myxococcus sp. SDU36 TaxID=2831967 RepID=UPI002543A329|nr:helix-turn-helix transcriptional regulator [Myxococcus sp. SDU36]WIG97877.1 helix-turn-helix domain-containing protein [Myxococcus sp. SDU36]
MDEELGATFGKAVREARARLGLTQVEVAALLDMHPMVYSRMERGKMLPRVSTLRHVAMVLRTSTDELLGLSREGHAGAKQQSALQRRLMTLSETLDEEQLKALVVMASALSR